MGPTVYIVHCIDTEGPLYESIDATFERLKYIFHLDLEPSPELLHKLQEGQVNLGGLEKSVQKVVDPQVISYNDTWDKIDKMLDEALSTTFRESTKDSYGGGWVYNWFCVDHVDYDVNPRRRDIGYHNIYDHYRRVIEDSNSSMDALHFHFHPHAILKHAHRSATHWWAASDALYQILSRRIIDRGWFPGVNRPGFQVNRPDSHWFLEQYIPFDMASLATRPNDEDEQQFDFSHGRSGDWRRAPLSWSPYHPAYDDYQVEGECRRWIARCLNVGTRAYLLDQQDVLQAFREAAEGNAVVMSFSSHDFRDIRKDVEYVRSLLEMARATFPDVNFKFSEATDAMRNALELKPMVECDVDLTLNNVSENAFKLTVRTDTPSFGPQPYFAIKTVAGDYHHDNLDFQIPYHEWTYVFDEETLPIRAIESIGIGVNNAYGNTSVTTLDTLTGNVKKYYWNR